MEGFYELSNLDPHTRHRSNTPSQHPKDLAETNTVKSHPSKQSLQSSNCSHPDDASVNTHHHHHHHTAPSTRHRHKDLQKFLFEPVVPVPTQTQRTKRPKDKKLPEIPIDELIAHPYLIQATANQSNSTIPPVTTAPYNLNIENIPYPYYNSTENMCRGTETFACGHTKPAYFHTLQCGNGNIPCNRLSSAHRNNHQICHYCTVQTGKLRHQQNLTTVSDIEAVDRMFNHIKLEEAQEQRIKDEERRRQLAEAQKIREMEAKRAIQTRCLEDRRKASFNAAISKSNSDDSWCLKTNNRDKINKWLDDVYGSNSVFIEKSKKKDSVQDQLEALQNGGLL